jgi:hypothetical protein
MHPPLSAYIINEDTTFFIRLPRKLYRIFGEHIYKSASEAEVQLV